MIQIHTAKDIQNATKNYRKEGKTIGLCRQWASFMKAICRLWKKREKTMILS